MKKSRSQQRSDSPKAAGSASGSARRQADATQRPFAVFDIDGTLIRWQLYHAIADALGKYGYLDSKDYDDIRRARMLWKKRTGSESFPAYSKRVVQAYDHIVKKLDIKQFEDAVDEVFDEYKDQVYSYTRDLIEKLKDDGYLLFAISGSQAEIVEKIAKYYGFDDYMASIYYRKGDHFTGAKRVASINKKKNLDSLMKRYGVNFTGSIAVGDSIGDIEMLEEVENPIAFNPDSKLLTHARDQGWEIVVERKNAIYELRLGQNGQYKLV